MKTIMRNWVLGVVVAGLLLAPVGCKKEKKPREERTNAVKEEGSGQTRPREERPNKVPPKKTELEERAELLKAREEAKRKEANVKDVRHPKYSDEMVATASKQAQEAFPHIAGAVGDGKSTLVLTFQDKVATEQTLVSLQVTGMDGEKIKGSVVRIDPKDKGTQLKEKDEVSLAKEEIVDWALVNEKGSFGQFLMREWLKFQSEHGDNDDAKNEAKARLAKMGEALPETAHVHAEGDAH